MVNSFAPDQSSLTLSLRSEVDSRRLLERDLDLDLEWLGAYKDSFMIQFKAVPKEYNLDKMSREQQQVLSLETSLNEDLDLANTQDQPLTLIINKDTM